MIDTLKIPLFSKIYYKIGREYSLYSILWQDSLTDKWYNICFFRDLWTSFCEDGGLDESPVSWPGFLFWGTCHKYIIIYAVQFSFIGGCLRINVPDIKIFNDSISSFLHGSFCHHKKFQDYRFRNNNRKMMCA